MTETVGPPGRLTQAPVRRIAIAVGDTAGHVSPALALTEVLRGFDGGARVVFFEAHDQLSAGVMAQTGEPIVAVPGAPIRRAGAGGIGRALVEGIAGARVARTALAAHGSRLVIGFGGFASASVLVAARTLGLRTAIHEANVEPGLANAWLARLVHRVYLADAGTPLPGGIHVGLPVRSSIAALSRVRKPPPDGRLRVLVTSGSRGAGFLAGVVPDLLRAVMARGVTVEVIEQADEEGTRGRLAAAYAPAGISATVTDFIADMAEAYKWADVAIARAGANTLAELAIAGMPSVIVPLADAAADHQTANARRWSAAGAGLSVQEHEWNSGVLADWLHALASDAARWQRHADAARALAHPDAAQNMAADCEQMMQGRW